MCLAQKPQCSDAGEARPRGPSVSSQALYHLATALPRVLNRILNTGESIPWKKNEKLEFDLEMLELLVIAEI